MSDGNDFPKVIQDANKFAPEKDLPGHFPSNTPGGKTEQLRVKYARFIVDESGSDELEAVMNDCLEGKKVLVAEKWYFTKDGDAVVVIKYYVPEPVETPKQPEENVIRGRRRLQKAMRGEK